MRGGRAVLFVAAALLCVAPPARSSDGPALSFYGTKGPVALPAYGDGQTAYRMPSGIAWELENRVDLDLFAIYYESTAKNALNDIEIQGAGGAGSFGMVLTPGRDCGPLEEDPESNLLSVHFGLYPELGAAGSHRNKSRFTTFPGKIGQKAGLLFVSAAVSFAYAPTDWLSVGVGFHALPATQKNRLLLGGSGQRLELGGTPQINGVPLPGNPSYGDFLDLFLTGEATDPTLLYESEMKTIQFSGAISLSLRPTDYLAIGIAYRPRSWAPLPFEGEARINAEATFQDALSGVDPAVQDLFLATLPDGGNGGFLAEYDAEMEGVHSPRSIRLSIAFWPTRRWLIAAELAWTEWHRAFGQSQVTLKNGNNRDFNFVLGSDRVTVKVPTRWTNEWTFSASTSFAATDRLTLRAGFHYGKSPMNPRVVGNLSTPAFASTSVMAGFGWWINDEVELNVLADWAIPTQRNAGNRTGILTHQETRYTSTQFYLHVGLSLFF